MRNFRWVFLGEVDWDAPRIAICFCLRSIPSAPAAAEQGPIMSVLSGLASEPRTPLSSKARMKRLARKSQNEKYRLKYLRLRRAAKATVFVSLGSAAPFLGTVFPTQLSQRKRIRPALVASLGILVPYPCISYSSSPVFS